MNPSDMVLAGLPRRFAALAVDACVCVVLYLILHAMGATGARMLVFYIAAAWLCFALPTAGRAGGSPGTRLAGLVVTDLAGERVRLVRASCRAFLSVLSAGMFGMGYLLMLFTRRRQTLHDMYTKTLVLDGRATLRNLNRDGSGAAHGETTVEAR